VSGTCPQLLHTKTSEKSFISALSQSIWTESLPFPFLYATAILSFNRFVSGDSLLEKSFTTSLSITKLILISQLVGREKSELILNSSPFTRNLINHASKTCFLIFSWLRFFSPSRNGQLIKNFTPSSKDET